MTSFYPPSVMFPLGVPSFPATFPAVTITPSSVTVASRASQTFVGGGGVAPFTYSIHINNSGGTIDAGTGVYTAGPIASNVSDTVRATDTNSSFADASVSVTALVPPATGLKLWLEANKGIGIVSGGVNSWADQSGNGNDMLAGISRPTLVASAINGLPGVSFGGNQFMQNTASNILTSGSDRTVMVVCKPAATGATWSPGGPLLVMRLTAPFYGMWCGVAGGLTYGYINGTINENLGSPPTLTGVPLLAEMGNASGAQPTYVINATAYTLSGGVATAETGTTGFLVGTDPRGESTLFFTGSICEILVYNRVISGADLTTIRAYIEAKYAIALGAP